jgi:hypothetical protein
LITSEFEPAWHREQTVQWMQSLDFETLTAMTDSTLPDGRTLAAYLGLRPDIGYVVRGLIKPERGANLGLLNTGEIILFFLYDTNGRFVEHRVYSVPRGEPRPGSPFIN